MLTEKHVSRAYRSLEQADGGCGHVTGTACETEQEYGNSRDGDSGTREDRTDLTGRIASAGPHADHSKQQTVKPTSQDRHAQKGEL
jgi:hypothetical protein